ncbi:GNAT acetyltransferase-like protein [Mollisia scopiformis]|uniref:GNAT acetyltransferase-like protein n=1 Tax=Mollisia scopiformis TaxID=149040 RepID=A0A194X164_MOLSC|nr:GNAT acetyltransferase-like protein [Mollisia scopiformis]KUJ13714.1 GNAT acetyltransferase-like protein [Mollisia scopiformis]
MRFQVSEGTFNEIHDYLSIMFAAYSDPLHPFVSALLPGISSQDPAIYTQGKYDEAERALSRWKANPFEKWVKVVDTNTGEIVSVSRWQIYTRNPFPNGAPNVEVAWLPDGGRLREYCTYITNSRLERQASRCSFPHIWLNMMGTLPQHRGRGAASLMLKWGIEKADSLDYEMFVEAADSTGGHVYRQMGFVAVDEYWTRRLESEPDSDWIELEEKYPFKATWMMRPKQGRSTVNGTGVGR